MFEVHRRDVSGDLFVLSGRPPICLAAPATIGPVPGPAVGMRIRDKRRTPNRSSNGFTLIELLIVIVIMGILATVVVFAVAGITNRGEASTCVSDARTLAAAVEAYFGQYRTTSLPSGGSGGDQYEITLQAAGFIRDVSVNWDVGADGSLTAQPGAPC
jgi:prepilin-type N-terminal cleavage/methylation domain-containing protein